MILEETENTPDRCKHFFKETDGVPLRDVIMAATPEFLPYKHFRLALYPVMLNGRSKSSNSHRVLEVGVTVANAQLVRSERTWIESILTSHLGGISNTTTTTTTTKSEESRRLRRPMVVFEYFTMPHATDSLDLHRP